MKLLTREREYFVQFYTQLSEPPSSGEHRAIGTQMLSLVRRLEPALAGIEVWAATSHDRLLLAPGENCTPSWRVIVQAVPWGGFEVRYLLPEDEAPWRGATVEGAPIEESETIEMVLTAIERSKAWSRV